MNRTTRFSRLTLSALGLLTASLAACGSEDVKTACSATESCGFGLTCEAEVCVEKPCGGPADCPSGYTCAADAGVCTAIECGCDTCDACPAGEVCESGLCVGGGAPCSDTAPCSGTDICDAGACRACEGAECPATCTDGSCPAGQSCNAETGVCEADAGLATCAACADSAECGAEGRCIQLQGGKACLPTCAADSDCAVGWTCQTGAAGAVCTPPNYRCEGCFATGCPDGQTCNATGACEATPAACTPACSGATPVCDAGACVECLTDVDCGAGRTCNVGAKVCEGQTSCTGATPYQVGDRCVECTTNSHCGDRFCDQATNTCSDDQCASCAAPYPACIQYEGQSYCVQCETNEDCVALNGEGSTCNTSTYACEGGVVAPANKCETDSDCAATAAGFSLRCHVASGFCYDTTGSRDDVTAFCPGNDGQVRPCQSLLALFGGGALPPLPGGGGSGGGTLPGFCSCDPGPLGIGQGTCLSGTCLDLGSLLGGGGGGASTPVCFSL